MRTFAIALLLAATLVSAQPPARHKDHRDKAQLRFELIFSRHGIRPPLVPNAKLDLLSSSPWPTWQVPLGELTPHGAIAMQRMGAYMRLDLIRDGLLPASGCLAPDAIYLYADNVERNIQSTRNTFLALEPGCPLPIRTMIPAPHALDPIFSDRPPNLPLPSAQVIAADRRAYTGESPSTYGSVASNPELRQLAHILAPDPHHPAARPILDNPNPLAAASSPVEDIELEYVTGKPMSEVGWGRVDEATLLRLVPLHVKQFSLGMRPPLISRVRASNLVDHILETLEQASQDKAIPGAIGPVGAQLVYLSGHDSNLYSVGGLLHADWAVEGIADPTPPDSQLVFELWQDPLSKQYTVRTLFRAQTYSQLRSATDLTLHHPPTEVRLTPPGCHAHTACSFAAFDRATRHLLDPTYIQPVLKPTRVATSTP